MKIRIAIVTVLIMFFTGCGVQAGEEAGSSISLEERGMVSPVNKARTFLEEMAEDKVMPDTGNYKKVKKKYPEWFGEDGKIVYPVLPGSAEWKKARNHRGMNASCQIPEEIVNAADTKILLTAVEEFPLLYASVHYDYYEFGLQYFAEVFYGMNVLLRREDACRAAAESYLSRNLKVLPEGYDDLQMREALLLEEFLISQEDAYYKFSEEERREILKAVEKNYDIEKKLFLACGGIEYHFYDMVAYGDNPWQSELP